MKKGSTGLLVLILAVVLMGVAAMYFMTRSVEVPKDSENVLPTTPIAEVGESISVTGEVVCLSQKDQSEAQTVGCALGVRTGTAYFGLLDPTPDYSFISKLGGGEHITVSGIFREVPPENKYVSMGVIEIQAIEPVAENNKL